MAGIVDTLAGLERLMDQASGNFEDGPKANWLKIDDGKSVKIHFLQELDVDSDFYDPKAGQALIVLEHSSPKNFRKKALCTAEDGHCYGCEQNRLEPKTGWKSKARMYVNVLVDDGKQEPYVAILSQGLSGKAITPTLAMFTKDSGTITQIQFRISRRGTGTSTEYTLVPIINSAPVDVTQYYDDLYNLKDVCTRDVPYAEQAVFYNDGDASNEAPSENAATHTEW